MSELLQTLDTIDVCFRSAFHLAPPIRCYSIVFFITVGFFTVVPFTFKVVEFIKTDQTLVILVHKGLNCRVFLNIENIFVIEAQAGEA